MTASTISSGAPPDHLQAATGVAESGWTAGVAMQNRRY